MYPTIFFCIASTYDDKLIGCNWKRKYNSSIKFKVYKNLETNDYKVKRYKPNKDIISVNNDYFKLNCYEYDAVYCNSYNMYAFVIGGLPFEIIQFIGNKPTSCFCISKHEQKTIFNENKNLNPLTCLNIHNTSVI